MSECSGIRRIALHYGLRHQIRKLMEELSELYDVAFDIAIHQDSLEGRLTPLVDEMADVRVMIAQIEELTGMQKAVAERMDYKIARQLDRIARGVERG